MHCSIPKPAPIDVCRCWALRRRLLSATAVATWRSQWPSAVVGGACLVPGLVWMVNDRAKNVYRSTVRPRLVTANAHTCCSSDGLTYYPHAPHRQMQAATVGGRIGSAFCAVSWRCECRTSCGVCVVSHRAAQVSVRPRLVAVNSRIGPGRIGLATGLTHIVPTPVPETSAHRWYHCSVAACMAGACLW